jgi:hypothetical protein
VLSGAACGTTTGVLIVFYMSGLDGTFGFIGGIVGAILGAVGGDAISRTSAVRVHWFEGACGRRDEPHPTRRRPPGALLPSLTSLHDSTRLDMTPVLARVCSSLPAASSVCYWSHVVVAYGTVPLALLARFDVFWPTIPCWGLLGFDRFLMWCDTHTFFIQARACRCLPGDPARGRSNKLRLVLRAERCAATAALQYKAAANWIYLRVPHMRGAGGLETRVLRTWHPFSLGAHSGDSIELLIDVHAGPVAGKRTFTAALYEHVLSLQQEDASARAKSAPVATSEEEAKVDGAWQPMAAISSWVQPAEETVLAHAHTALPPTAFSAQCLPSAH